MAINLSHAVGVAMETETKTQVVPAFYCCICLAQIFYAFKPDERDVLCVIFKHHPETMPMPL